MPDQKRFQIKEFLLMALPALLFIIWAWFTSEQDVRSNITGKWRTTNGHIIENRVQGNELLVWQNGRKDPLSNYYFRDDNVIEFIDRRRKRSQPILITLRIRRGVLEQNIGTEHVRAYRIE